MSAESPKSIVGGGFALLSLFWASVVPLFGEDSGPPPVFSTILEEHTARTFYGVKTYIEEHPQAADAEQAYEWLFKTAREQGWESKAVSLARIIRRGGNK